MSGFRSIAEIYVIASRLCKLTVLWVLCGLTFAQAQVPPSASEIAAYTGLHAAAQKGDASAVRALATDKAKLEARDGGGRTPLHVAAHGSHYEIVRALVQAGADPRALDAQRYDIVTSAAVKDDTRMVELALELGSDAKAITSPYDGTALIAAAHLGHDGAVRALIRAGAPVDHVNNLGWTALIESIVLGQGGPRHIACLKALLDAGANPNLADRNGQRPLQLARARGYGTMAELIEKAGGR